MRREKATTDLAREFGLYGNEVSGLFVNRQGFFLMRIAVFATDQAREIGGVEMRLAFRSSTGNTKKYIWNPIC